jgi:hypothetical protein
MKHAHSSLAHWSTASFGNSVEPLPVELESLQAHILLCKQPQNFAFVVQQSGKVLSSFLTARVVTTLVAVLLAASCIYAW